MSITPIPTLYDGVTYRSRLEARWALFFKALSIGARYETEGFDIDGLLYLPDFWLPKAGIFVEIKPEALKPAERQRVRALVIGSGKQCMVLDGPPAARPYLIFSAVELDGEICEAFQCPHILSEDLYRTEGRFFSDPCLDPETWIFSDRYMDAVAKANTHMFWPGGLAA